MIYKTDILLTISQMFRRLLKTPRTPPQMAGGHKIGCRLDIFRFSHKICYLRPVSQAFAHPGKLLVTGLSLDILHHLLLYLVDGIVPLFLDFRVRFPDLRGDVTELIIEPASLLGFHILKPADFLNVHV